MREAAEAEPGRCRGSREPQRAHGLTSATRNAALSFLGTQLALAKSLSGGDT